MNPADIPQVEPTGFEIIEADLVENNDPRCPAGLLLDTSGSMAGSPIQALKEGLECFASALASDPLAMRRVEAAIVTFGGRVRVARAFTTAAQLSVPNFGAGGHTPMGAAVNKGIDLVTERRREIARSGVPLYCPWLFLITDGRPTDYGSNDWKRAVERVQVGVEKRQFLFFAVGVEGADFQALRELSPSRAPVALDGLRFKDLFLWLSASLSDVSRSTPGDTVDSRPVSWGSIAT